MAKIIDDLADRYFSPEQLQALDSLGGNTLRDAKAYMAGSNNAMEPFKHDIMAALAAHPDSPVIAQLLGDSGAAAITAYTNGLKIATGPLHDKSLQTRGENAVMDAAGRALVAARKEGTVTAPDAPVEPVKASEFKQAVTAFVGATAAAQADAVALGAGGNFIEPYKKEVFAAVQKAIGRANAAPITPLDPTLPDAQAVATQRLKPEDLKNIQTVLGSQGVAALGRYMVGAEIEASTGDHAPRINAQNAILELAGQALRVKREASLDVAAPERHAQAAPQILPGGRAAADAQIG